MRRESMLLSILCIWYQATQCQSASHVISQNTSGSIEIHVMPGYLHFGYKYNRLENVGASVGISRYIGSSLGATVDAGYYFHNEKTANQKQSNRLLNVTAGIIYLPRKQRSRLDLSLHGMIGVSRYVQTMTYSNSSFKVARYSVNFNIGGALNWRLSQFVFARLLEADYTPTFFYEAIQQNIRLSAGIVYRMRRRIERSGK